MFIGRVIGVLLGLFAFKSFIGVVLGFVAGWYFDRSLTQVDKKIPLEGQSKSLFLQTLFTTLGRLAKSDGRVSKQEIAYAEEVIKSFDLDAQGRQQAIEWFDQGVKQTVDFDALLAQFVEQTHRQTLLRRNLLELLLELVLVDSLLHPKEEEALLQIAIALGVSAVTFQALLQQLKAQYHFHQEYRDQHQQKSSYRDSADPLSDAYKALGVQASDSDAVVKRAYRKLISANHPDKLIAQGLPEAAIKKATERSQAIQQAYDLIKKSRR